MERRIKEDHHCISEDLGHVSTKCYKELSYLEVAKMYMYKIQVGPHSI